MLTESIVAGFFQTLEEILPPCSDPQRKLQYAPSAPALTTKLPRRALCPHQLLCMIIEKHSTLKDLTLTRTPHDHILSAMRMRNEKNQKRTISVVHL